MRHRFPCSAGVAEHLCGQLGDAATDGCGTGASKIIGGCAPHVTAMVATLMDSDSAVGCHGCVRSLYWANHIPFCSSSTG
jgi:hypothetical protein